MISTHLKNISQIGSFPPGRGENTKYLKPPPRPESWQISQPFNLQIFPSESSTSNNGPSTFNHQPHGCPRKTVGRSWDPNNHQIPTVSARSESRTFFSSLKPWMFFRNGMDHGRNDTARVPSLEFRVGTFLVGNTKKDPLGKGISSFR